jgi:predicted lipoprotein with Yx(FWY)xxD motif
MTRPALRSHIISLITATAVGMLTLAACGSSSSSNAGTAASGSGSPAAAPGTTVDLRTVGGKSNVLTDPQGRTLYVNDQERGGKPLCNSSDCTQIWIPLTVPAGKPVSAPPAATGSVGTTTRADGSKQVTVNGKPLYTFYLDQSSGQDSGDGQADSFDGTSFSWHIATTSSNRASGSSAPASSGGTGGY